MAPRPAALALLGNLLETAAWHYPTRVRDTEAGVPINQIRMYILTRSPGDSHAVSHLRSIRSELSFLLAMI